MPTNVVAKKLTWRKGQLQKQANDFEARLNSVSDPPTENELKTIEAQLEPFSETMEEFQQIASDLFDQEVDIGDEQCEYKNSFYKLVGSAKLLIEKAKINNVPENIAANTEAPSVKLPVIEIPTFTGQYDEWPGFADSFKSLIHSNQSLTNINRFHYLQSSLKGEAALILKSLKLSDAGYELAWKRLCERYENERFIVKKHVQKLLTLPSIKRDNYTSLRHLIDVVALTLASLKALKRPTDTWGDLIVEIVADKLDHNLQKEWEGRTCDKIPSYEELELFLTNKCKQLEAVNASSQSANDQYRQPKSKTFLIKGNERKCVMCGGEHSIYKCKEFLEHSTQERITIARQKNLCYNCLGKGHILTDCKSGHCRECNKRHHSLLHLKFDTRNNHSSSSSTHEKTDSTTVGLAYAPSRVLLSTCEVIVKGQGGKIHHVRALLDSGSQANLISESCADRIGLKREPISAPIVGIGGAKSHIKNIVRLTLNSRTSPYSIPVTALVIKTITDKLPSRIIDHKALNLPAGIELADPNFFEPKDVDILVGAGLFYDVMCDGRIKRLSLTLNNTHFGWIISGDLPCQSETITCDTLTVGYIGLNEQITRFWELESHKRETLTHADQLCERHFKASTTRDASGRFQVALPFKDDAHRLGNSSESAQRRFFALERRLAKQKPVYDEYRKFMAEYEELNHMHKTNGDIHGGYYLPHHCVLKETSLTTKLRVVFNASAPTSTGLSLNDILMTGPPLQDDLFSIMLRMRTRQYVITADIAKMYRQVNVRPEDRKYQRIWWRNSPEEKLTSYELATATYGTACGAYLAIRSLRELAHTEALKFPIGSRVCLADFYVDDLITGTDSIKDLIQVRDEVDALLRSGGFELKRWASNNNSVFKYFKTDIEDSVTILTRDNSESNQSVTTLGTIWNTIDDVLSYKHCLPRSTTLTKRAILSEISRIYDPLGLIGPVTIIAKVIIQDLWKLKCSWDDPLPTQFSTRWTSYSENLTRVTNIKIPRKVISEANLQVELHCFADASEHAYGACAYVVAIKAQKRVSSNLLCAKSRVAPVKAVSIPRLELCAALLVAELGERICESLDIKIDNKYYYTDSNITLSWIKADSRRFKTFVSNRIGEIQRLTDPDDWYHVKTKENPADIISRGMSPSDLEKCNLWWHGPNFILNRPIVCDFISEPQLPEMKCNIIAVQLENVIIPHCSSYEKTIRVTAYILRYMNNCNKMLPKIHGALSMQEYHKATLILIKNVQRTSFYRELELLKKAKCVQKCSKLYTLNPFLDTHGLIRVGGRLSKADLSFNKRFPIVLPANNHITNLIVTSVHKSQLHIGCQGTLATIRLKYWPLNGRSTVRCVLRKCIVCLRAKPRFEAPIMGALPLYRTQQFRPFMKTGVDFCGPFMVKDGPPRSKRTTKAYVCIFVCFSTKAVHIELVSNLSTEAFLASLNRFIARRGCVAEIFSDNATNFAGARNKLRDLGTFLNDPELSKDIQESLLSRHIKWNFIPPRAPHFGGLWEAAVKSVKHHLNRIAGKALLTFEELTTFLTQIEAVLNSRPLCPLSEDPSDYSALTPGHFLIGDVLTAPVDPDYLEEPMNRLSRWQLVGKLRQQVWKRWSREYLTELHKRAKWQTKSNISYQPGQLVIIKEDNVAPLQWKLGRINAVHPGKDGITRSATVRTHSGEYVRPVVKLCPLPCV